MYASRGLIVIFGDSRLMNRYNRTAWAAEMSISAAIGAHNCQRSCTAMLVEKHPGKEKREKDDRYQKPLKDSFSFLAISSMTEGDHIARYRKVNQLFLRCGLFAMWSIWEHS